MRVFFVVLARDASAIEKKAGELVELGYPYVIVCGENVDRSDVIYREPKGKYDAVNFGMRFIPSETEVVAFNDADTTIFNFEAAVNLFRDSGISLVFARVDVKSGPQLAFYSFLDPLRKRIPVAASGELMLVRYSALEKILPLKECKAEDTYILFKVLENGGRIDFCENCYVTTKRTSLAVEEKDYKRRTVGGIYQALSMSKPPNLVKVFYMLLPFLSPLLLISGKKGYYWTKGILLGYVDFIRGDRVGIWQKTYI